MKSLATSQLLYYVISELKYPEFYGYIETKCGKLHGGSVPGRNKEALIWF